LEKLVECKVCNPQKKRHWSRLKQVEKFLERGQGKRVEM
jgi:hypothetical protein